MRSTTVTAKGTCSTYGKQNLLFRIAAAITKKGYVAVQDVPPEVKPYY